MRIAIMAIVVGLSAGCTNPDKTTQTLSSMGFTHVTVGGYAWLACGDDYTYATEFTATNPVGQRVSGAVCCGILKGCTAKF